MKKFSSRKFVVLFILIGMLVMGTAVVHAITITIDGLKEAAWDNPSGQIPGSQTDLNEGDIDDRYDIAEIKWTNDSTGGSAPYGNMYWLFETYANFDYNFPASEPLILVCLDTDNNSLTGTDALGYCDDMLGVDRRIRIFPGLGSVQVQNGNGTGFTNIAQPVGGLRAVAYSDPGGDGVADTPYIEAGFDLQSLGITDGSTCINTMRASVYYDNGILDGEDQVTDSGSFQVSCGTPTAVNLQTFSAANNTSTLPIIGISLLAVLALVSAGVFIARREQTNA